VTSRLTRLDLHESAGLQGIAHVHLQSDARRRALSRGHFAHYLPVRQNDDVELADDHGGMRCAAVRSFRVGHLACEAKRATLVLVAMGDIGGRTWTRAGIEPAKRIAPLLYFKVGGVPQGTARVSVHGAASKIEEREVQTQWIAAVSRVAIVSAHTTQITLPRVIEETVSYVPQWPQSAAGFCGG
jgi:hypothetical protein